MTLSIVEEVNFIREVFQAGQIFGCCVGFSPISRISSECLGGQGGIILGDNPAGQCFVLMNLVPMSFLK